MMSKPSIKFIYSGEFRSQVAQFPNKVQHLQKGPPKLDNLYISYARPEFIEIPRAPSMHQVIENTIPTISTVEVNSKPTSPTSIIRYKSVEHLNGVKSEETSQKSGGILNIEEINESELKFVNQKKKDSKKPINGSANDQIILNAPSYKFVPKKEGELTVKSRKQCQKTTSVQRPLNGQAENMKRASKKLNEFDLILKAANPILKIQAVEENEFLKDQPETKISQPRRSRQEKPQKIMGQTDQIVLKAPKYSYNPVQQNDLAVNSRRKQYVRAQNTTQKYFYNGVPQSSESNFIGCFGCVKPQAKIYSNQDDNTQ